MIQLKRMLKSAAYFSVQTGQRLKHTDSMFTSTLHVLQEYMCAVKRHWTVCECDVNWLVRFVCFKGNTMIPKFQAVSTVSPRIFQ